MVRIENIQSKLTQLVKYLELVERYQAQTFSELLIDPDRLGACERYLFLACQCEIGNDMKTVTAAGRPSRNRAYDNLWHESDQALHFENV